MKQCHWTELPFVAFDCETTGVDITTARILQAAIVTHAPENVPFAEEDRVIYIQPDVPIPPEASAVHGFTAEKLKELDAFEPKAGIEYIVRIISGRACNRNYPLVIYNAPFDWPLLMAECARYGVEPPERFPMFLDPLVIDRAADKYRKGSRKLEDVARFYGVKMEGAAHGAQADAKAALGIMRALIERYPELKKCTLAGLQGIQAKWYQQWKDHLNEYWASIGKEDRITGSWPSIGDSQTLSEAKGAA